VNRIDLIYPTSQVGGATLTFGGAAPAINALGGPHFVNNLVDLQADGLVIATDGLFISQSEHLARLAVRPSEATPVPVITA